jgi:hypothetical protein
MEKECQFGCLNFLYKSGVVSPVTAYRNKWPSDLSGIDPGYSCKEGRRQTPIRIPL